MTAQSYRLWHGEQSCSRLLRYVCSWHSSTVRGIAPILPLSGGKLTAGGIRRKGRS
jgi:hypothetical protein